MSTLSGSAKWTVTTLLGFSFFAQTMPAVPAKAKADLAR
jgi:hypothetical protein